jgi:hypothetical protein
LFTVFSSPFIIIPILYGIIGSIEFIEIFILIIIFESIVFGPIGFLYIIGYNNLKKNSLITDDTYYSPGMSKSRSELKINKNGIYLSLWGKKPNGKADISRFDTISYENIKSIIGKDNRIFIREPKIITGLEIRTFDDRKGVIGFYGHSKNNIYRLLKKYLKNKWKDIYSEDLI